MVPMFEPISEIDISSLYSTIGSRTTELDNQIVRALMSDGAFVATNLRDSDHLDQKIARLMRFFKLSHKIKLRYATKTYQPSNPNNYRGYYPPPKTPDWAYKESFDIGPEPAMTSPNVRGAESFREPNVWPNDIVLPMWRSEMLEQLRQLRLLGTLLMRAIARGLNVDPEQFLAASKGRNASMRLLSRPTLPEEFRLAVLNDGNNGHKDSYNKEPIRDGRRIITGCHVDENLLSILWQSPAGGLQMKGTEGTWREVYPRAGTLSIHCGTLLTGLSHNQLNGTPHRVVSDGASRTSLGHFLEPDFETDLYIPNNTSPISYAQHLVSIFPDRFIQPNTPHQ